MSITRYCCLVIIMGCTSMLLPLRSYSEDKVATFEIIEIKKVSKQSNFYHGWPTLARSKSGKLFVTWSSRDSHICPFGRVEMMTSHDDGKTWTWPRVLLDTDLDDRDSGVMETARGTMIVTTFTSLHYSKNNDYKKDPAKIAAHARIVDEEKRKAQLGEFAIRSTDNGVSWSKPIATVVNSPHGPIQLSNGRLLYAGKQLWTKERKIGVAISSDDGKSWKWLADIPTRPRDHGEDYHELHAVEAANGTIIAHIRDEGNHSKGETLQTESKDEGKTWSVPHSIGVWGVPSFLTRLMDKRLLMTYGYRRKPFGIQARVSDDNGKSWSKPITISDDGISWDLGYPSTVQLGDGSLLTVWYENNSKLFKHWRAVLRQAHWKLK